MAWTSNPTEQIVLSVHRCRFVDFAPSAITALAFPPLPLPSSALSKKTQSAASSNTPWSSKFSTLAVGRANGNIELCEWTGAEHQNQAPQAWVVRKTLFGPTLPAKVDALTFAIRYPEQLKPGDVPRCSDLRLFSTGGGSDLLEWDLEHSCVLRSISSQGGSIWSIAVNPASNLLALGCEDGAVRLLSLEHGSLAHFRRFDRVKCRLLSIAWGPPVPSQNSASGIGSEGEEEEDPEWLDEWLVTGGSDSSLRKWDIRTGRVLDRMGTDKMRGERTLVWAVGVLGNGTIVSGDSLGMVKFWDSRTCTQLQSFQSHGADVLCLTISSEGTAVYTSGVDQKISQFAYIKTSTPDGPSTSSTILRAPNKWVHTFSRRLHSHDVRALSIWPPHVPIPSAITKKHNPSPLPSDVAPVLVSGGLDMSVVLTPCALPSSTTSGKVLNPLATSGIPTFEESYQRRIAYCSGPASTSGVCVARRAALVLCMRESGLTLWRILRKKPSLDEDEDENNVGGIKKGGGWEKVLEMELNAFTNLVSSSISDDGRWLAVSDLYETKLFALDTIKNGDIKPKRIRDFTSILQPHLPSKPVWSTGASSLAFSPDSSKLVLTTYAHSYVLIIDLGREDHTPRVLRKFEHHRTHNVFVGPRRRVIKGRRSGLENDVEMVDEDEDEEFEETVEMEATPEPPEDDEGTGVTSPVFTTISRSAISADGQWLATSDDRCCTHVFNLDSIQHHCVLPSFPQPAHALSFDPSSPSTLFIGLANNTIQIFDVESRTFPEWSRELCDALPKRFTHAQDPLLGVAFDPGTVDGPGVNKRPRYALVWSSTWMCKVRLDVPAGWGGLSKKRRREQQWFPPVGPLEREDEEYHFRIITQYRPLLLVEFLGSGELLVVERPLNDVLTALPPAFFKPKYGT